LTSIQAFLGVLAKGAYGELSEHGLMRSKTATNGIKRLIGMVNDLLDIDKMEAGMLELQCENVELQPIFEQSMEAARGFAEQNQVKIVAQPSSLTVYADADRVARVLINLLGNAIKFSPPQTTVSLTAAS